ncbi:bifunctional farnesyl-diphosphate farnesyltransferase/squalene synthase [Sticta canariensis]|nr:bifunctional farnesyl-diphosphate farnesyltransferase/squalene synthase [Sticta canariensis]
MGAGDILYYLIHHQELRSIIQWKVWHNAVHERDEAKEAPSLKACFELLEKTSRSFSAVILELHHELLVPVSIFYLCLRGMDTIEDDMTLPLDRKIPLLRNFYTFVTKEGWSFDESGPDEKDRLLLVNFHLVVEEFKKLKPEYQDIIADITRTMGNGMADYASSAEHNANIVNTVKEYDLYCHYVAGLVGNGLTRLFVQSGLANPALLDRPHLQESMGLFLQKTNIIRDVREDFDEKRRFWPKEIWSKYVTNFEDLFEPGNIDVALNCSSNMVLNSLSHADECIFYLAGLKEQSVFNFAAIPQSMAMATLELVFRNPAVFRKNVKISKGQACQIMVESTQNLRMVCAVFRRFARKIHKKNTPKDPNFLKISIACAKIEQFIESIFPSQDPKVLTQQQQQISAGETRQIEKDPRAEEARKDTILMLVAVMAMLLTLSCIMIGVAYLCGARFDIAISDLTRGKTSHEAEEAVQSVNQKYEHKEL